MKFGSLFAGIGGFDLGLERAGMQCSWQVEIDDYATRVLEKHWPRVKRYSDVRECGAHNLKPVDLICGGFPCQPHSLAGKRKASADERDLWGEFARIIRELRPKYVVAENVPGLLSSESGRFFGRVLRDLASSGYDAEWQCLPASTFGAHFVGDRVWIIATNTAANGCRLSWEPLKPIFKVWCNDEFERLVRRALQHAVPAGKRGRVSDGLPNRSYRLKSLGNAVVPQVVEWIGKRILEYDRLQH